MHTCQSCGRKLPDEPSRTGRPRIYCGTRCRQRIDAEQALARQAQRIARHPQVWRLKEMEVIHDLTSWQVRVWRAVDGLAWQGLVVNDDGVLRKLAIYYGRTPPEDHAAAYALLLPDGRIWYRGLTSVPEESDAEFFQSAQRTDSLDVRIGEGDLDDIDNQEPEDLDDHGV